MAAGRQAPLLLATHELRDQYAADFTGAVLEASGAPEEFTERAETMTVTLQQLGEVGGLAGLGALETLVVQGPAAVLGVAVRAEAFLAASADPEKAGGLERALAAWSAGTPLPSPTPAPAADRRGAAGPTPTPPPLPAARPVPRARDARPDGWAALRRVLVRGRLTEAAALERRIEDPPPGTTPRPGSEPLAPGERAQVLERLLEGIGMVMAGDGLGGAAILEKLAAPGQGNLSFRWIALQWSAWAGLRTTGPQSARGHIQEALKVAGSLDIEARAVSQWTAAEMLSQGDPRRALAWVTESRNRFERLRDSWGLARTWLLEARIVAAASRDAEAEEAARKAAGYEPEWDEPLTFLARRALLRDDVAEAERVIAAAHTAPADRVRALIGALRDGSVSRADATDYLRECDAPPSAQSVRVLQRIAASAPGFLQAQDALAWLLLKTGSYEESGNLFRGLLDRELSSADRASAQLGLRCVAHAQGERPSAAAPADGAAPGAAAAPALKAMPGNGDPDAVFSGRLSVFALTDLLEFLRSARRTGLLVCSTGEGMGALRLRDGRITGATSPRTPPLLQLLQDAHPLSPEALAAVAARQAAGATDAELGEVLARDGHVEADAVRSALSQGIELAVRELVGWTDGEFAFNREEVEPAADAQVGVDLDPQAVLLKVFKDMDEAARNISVDVEI